MASGDTRDDERAQRDRERRERDQERAAREERRRLEEQARELQRAERELQRQREEHERELQRLEREQRRFREEAEREMQRIEREARMEAERAEREALLAARQMERDHWRSVRDELRNEAKGEGKKGQPPSLNLNQIIRAALELADKEGSDAISMRRIAGQLKAGAMSLYWHVANKDELIQLMVDEAYAEMDLPAKPSGDWRADIRSVAIETRQLFLRHPWIAQLGPLGRKQMGPGFLRHAEFSFAAFEASNLPKELRLDIVHVVDDYTIGFVTREIVLNAVTAQESSPEWRKKASQLFERAAASGLFPVLTRLYRDGAEFPQGADLDRLFLFGLDSLLDGISFRLGITPARPE